MSALTSLRALLMKDLRAAGREAEQARAVYAAPYSSFDATVAFFKARGVEEGLARAIERLDAEDDPEDFDPEDFESPGSKGTPGG